LIVISETTDIEGNLRHGKIVCDNAFCQKTLYSYSKWQDRPPSDRDCFYALAVTLRVVINGPVTQQMLQQLDVPISFVFRDKAMGYHIDSGSSPMMLDFCSLECVHEWLNEHQEYGLVFYGSLSREVRFIEDRPSRFSGEVVSPSQAVGPRQDGHQLADMVKDGVVRIRGKSFKTRVAPMLMPGEVMPQIGIIMNTLLLKCPMTASEGLFGSKACHHLIQMIAEFTPSAWVCPHCKGLLMMDVQQEAHNYNAANLRLAIPNSDIVLFCYFGYRLNWDDKKTTDWIKYRIGRMKPIYADPFEDEQQMAGLLHGDLLLAPVFTDLEEIRHKFGYLID
jgi:hypothetical protein